MQTAIRTVRLVDLLLLTPIHVKPIHRPSQICGVDMTIYSINLQPHSLMEVLRQHLDLPYLIVSRPYVRRVQRVAQRILSPVGPVQCLAVLLILQVNGLRHLVEEQFHIWSLGCYLTLCHLQVCAEDAPLASLGRSFLRPI